ncbi:MAG: hypothetical protein V4812_03485 [Pseudomonadota bacterium]
MSPRLSVLLLVVLALVLAAAYGLRFALMEDGRWVADCLSDPLRWECRLRADVGLLVHFGVLGWAGLVGALLAFVLPGRWGQGLAALALLFAALALVLYSASLASFALVIAGLRLVRAPARLAEAR